MSSVVILGRINCHFHVYQNIETLVTVALKVMELSTTFLCSVCAYRERDYKFMNPCLTLFFTGIFLKITF